MNLLNLADYEEAAAAQLESLARDYYRSGARDEITLRENRAVFDRARLRFRVLAGVSEIETTTAVFGHPVSMPVLAAPTAFHKLAHPEGEIATARGVGGAGTVMCLSTLSNSPVEKVVEATAGPVFFQLYVYRDRGATRALVDRVREAGVRALLLTVDAPVLGTRERDVRNEFRLPDGLDMPNATAEPYRRLGSATGDSALGAWVKENLDPGLTWDDLDWLCDVSGLPVVVKGIVREDDADRAVGHGAAGIVVSNHGGRQLDTSVTTLEALPEVVEGANGRCAIWLDGGVRRGTDVVKALALGAEAVLVGRPILWGLAVDGSEGVTRVLGLLRAELEEAMRLCGARHLDELTRDLVAP